ncbi:DnaJ domain [Desulfacinum hydrothermale DSM 13146]|uniref:DnaJ domain n=1 Tax=Desulfacinum hydrothermale DSM 13146 TaxID=1121390 RepID=A0A1W1X544_9BACT|nr:J domain-containing protein [Desulfacinum hydrothermale]SMC18967.1 DnaJ domain [Desulfacinum hydrothermale DSM 13146]
MRLFVAEKRWAVSRENLWTDELLGSTRCLQGPGRRTGNLRTLISSREEILRACSELFGPHVRGDLGFLSRIDAAAVKKAFRHRALATHPDRIRQISGTADPSAHDAFLRVKEAYDLLDRLLAQHGPGAISRVLVQSRRCAHPTPRRRPRRSPSPPTAPRQRTRRATAGPGFTSFRMPQRPLRFGEFLYFRRVITWHQLIEALVWQRRQRPRLGEIASRWRWISQEELEAYLRGKAPGDRIGQVLVRHGLITPFQLRVLLYQQRRLQRPIGHFFVDAGLLSPHVLDQLLRHQAVHNRKTLQRKPA